MYNKWNELAKQLFKIKQTRKYYEQQEKILIEDLKSISNNMPFKGEKYELKSIIKTGSIDYSKIELLKDLDLSQYRKESTTSWILIENLILPE